MTFKNASTLKMNWNRILSSPISFHNRILFALLGATGGTDQGDTDLQDSRLVFFMFTRNQIICVLPNHYQFLKVNEYPDVRFYIEF